MNSFEFGRPVKICGEVYYLSSDMESMKNALIAHKNNMSTGAMDSRTELAYMASIDVMLGAGSAKKIFAGRKITPLDCASLMRFLGNEIKEWQKESRSLEI